MNMMDCILFASENMDLIRSYILYGLWLNFIILIEREKRKIFFDTSVEESGFTDK